MFLPLKRVSSVADEKKKSFRGMSSAFIYQLIGWFIKRFAEISVQLSYKEIVKHQTFYYYRKHYCVIVCL